MELLLTGAVNRLLARFVKSAGGEAGSDLRVSLGASGTVVGLLAFHAAAQDTMQRTQSSDGVPRSFSPADPHLSSARTVMLLEAYPM